MSSSLLTQASAMTALKNLTASAQGRREGVRRDVASDRRPTEDGSSSGEAPTAGSPPGAAPISARAPSGTPSGALSHAPSYVVSLSEAITSGVGSLVRADMDLGAARLRALQAQKLLGTQAVCIANQHSQLVLKLFGG